MSDPSTPGPRSRGGLRVLPGGADDARPAGTDPVGAGPAPSPGAPTGPGPDWQSQASRPQALETPELLPPPAPGERWTDAEADAWLASRDLVGWRFALDRIRQLLGILGDPHRAAPSIHVVGTNGKSSTTRMAAALLTAHGRRSGAFLSPHLAHLRERIEIDGRPISAALHAEAVAEVARAAVQVDRPGDPVTQFEAHTAAAFVALAAAGADVFVIEAGLGGRLDATNVIDAPVVALTSVDLDHTALLGDTVGAITAEKVAVVTPGSTLVLGADLHEDAIIVARNHAAQVEAQVVTAKPEPLDRRLGAPYQQRNFALARAACELYLGALDLRIVREVAADFAMPARFEVIGTAPTTILDGAHNPAGAAALVAALDGAGLGEGRGVAVMSVFSDKDAAGMVRALARRCDRFIACHCGSPRALRPTELAAIVRQEAPQATVEVVEAPLEAVARARGVVDPAEFVLICGTLALAHAVRPPDPEAAA